MLIVAMLLAAVIALMLGSYLNLNLNSARQAFRSFQGYAAMNLVEAGAEEALWSFNRAAEGQANDLPTAGSGSRLVTYAYDSSSTGETAGCFYRVVGPANSAQPRRVLVRNVSSNFSFNRYKLDINSVTDNVAANDLETKLIQINLTASRTAHTVGTTSQTSRSARYLLRNKRVTN